ncbi:kinesin-like protein KIN-12B [Impatiens glandulifera]|uniref:kinesin-like protein KIN-12B n=1 Tax=Impatiens glandulifera TaxID=253017 RepID=UPI001FB0DBEC|nr:kinesin-like protein KIN-12B [Impatiens glandulifera]
MKHFMLPRNAILRENHPPAMENPSSSPNPKQKNPSRKLKYTKENLPPPDPNAMMPESALTPSSVAGKPSPASASKMKSLLPPRPPSSNPLKRKHTNEENGLPISSDSGVKVIVRVRPPTKDEQEGEMIVQKVSNDTLSSQGQTFTFDSIADTGSTQQDIFQLVGAPLVENCLAGFNSSVFAYGQTGSGKTFTIWGPANALFEENLTSDQQGLTPRVFERLFARINEEENKNADKELVYKCRCSFLEIYNEQITDLLDPCLKNLQIREDVNSGVYVENLTEESVSSMKDIKHLLTKGLSNRRIGSTSINAESSRSHSVFTCVVESHYKNAGDGLSCFTTSRINLVDLAGSERQKVTGAAGERLKEAGNINKSLSQLGNLINILAEISQTGKPRHIPYRDSRLTFLLQESLGGNAKLAMICAISPAQSCKNETWSTLRFAQRAKAIKNKAVVNEVMQDDVNTLREVISQLRDELVRLKANVNQPNSNSSYSTGWNARRSLSLLKLSLNRSMKLSNVDNDSDEEMEVVEEVAKLGFQSDANIYLENDQPDSLSVDCDEDILEPILGTPEVAHIEKKQGSPDIDINMEEYTPEKLVDRTKVPNLSLVSLEKFMEPKSPSPSVSPREVTDSTRKSLRTSAVGPKNSNAAFASERLANSLQRGLDVIEGHNRQSCRMSSFRYSYKPADVKLFISEEDKVDIGTQTIPQDYTYEEEENSHMFLCGKCKTEISPSETQDLDDTSNMQIVPVEGPHSVGCKSMMQLPKAVQKVLAGSIRREMALEQFSAKQTQEIIHLNRLLQQYKHERECNAIIGQTREDKIVRLEGLMDGVFTAEEFMDEELVSLTNEHKLLKEKYDNNPEILRTGLELTRVQEELERYKNFYDLGERDVLMEEVQDLRNQLQGYIIDSSSPNAMQNKRRPFLQLTYSCDPCIAPQLYKIPEPPSVEEVISIRKLEEERSDWAEAESKWISLAEELKAELESSQSLSKKLKCELDLEKRCTEELKEAMQLALEGHARMLEQYADLEEKHMEMLVRHRNIKDGIEDVKKAAAKAGVRGAESKFINVLAAELSSLKVEREKERRYLKDENKGLMSQLRDTAEAVQAAGELLVRLKEAEEEVFAAQKRAEEAEHEREKMYRRMDKLKKKHEKEINSVNRLIEEARIKKEEAVVGPVYDEAEVKEEFDLVNLTEEPSWFSGYDRCNI